MLSELRRIIAFLPPPMRRSWALLVPFALVGAVLEGFGVVFVFAWVHLINDPSAGLVLRVADGIRVGATLGERELLATSSAFLVAYFIAKSGLLLLFSYLSNRFTANAVVSVSGDLFRRYLGAPREFHFSHTIAKLTNNMLTATQRIFNVVVRAAAEVLSESMLLVGVMTMLVYTVPSGSLLAVVAMGALLGVALRVTQRLSSRLGETAHAANASLLRYAHQGLGAVKEAKLLRLETFFSDKFDAAHRRYSDALAVHTTISGAPRMVLESLFIAVLASIVVMLTVVEAPGPDTLPLLALFGFAGFRILPSVHRLVTHANSFRFARAALDDLERDWKALEHQGQLTDVAPVAQRFTDSIELRAVSYRYPGAERLALDGVDLRIAAGESVGIVGSSGAGKSTLVDVLLGLLVPATGEITVDGVALSLGGGWAASIGYVPQDIFLLDDTVRANVALGVDATDEERIWEALKAAQLDHFVATLPHGLDEWVGERGVRLSGGQKQRVAIARALYRRPAVLVFDEATSSLDSVTERDVNATIAALGGTRTLIVVAHRLTTVRGCDRIVVLHEGRVVADGKYEQLIERSAVFRELAMQHETA